MKELKEESSDFFDDFVHPKKVRSKLKNIKFYKANTAVRPAYLFAVRIEGLLHVIIGVSVFVSGMFAAFWGFTRTSELLGSLINSVYGRILMVVIGFSYFVLGIWKLLNLHK